MNNIGVFQFTEEIPNSPNKLQNIQILTRFHCILYRGTIPQRIYFFVLFKEVGVLILHVVWLADYRQSPSNLVLFLHRIIPVIVLYITYRGVDRSERCVCRCGSFQLFYFFGSALYTMDFCSSRSGINRERTEKSRWTTTTPPVESAASQ